MPARKSPSVVVLTEEALAGFVAEIQRGFADLTARLDQIEERMNKPGLATAKLRQDLATQALKAVVTRPAPRRTPRKQA